MAVIVNGEKIEDSVIQQEFERLRPDYERVFKEQSPEQQKAQLLAWSRENVIERVLINQEAKRRSNQIPEAEIESALAEMKEQCERQLSKEVNAEDEKKIKEHVELQMRVEQMLQDVCGDLPEPSKEAVQEFYEENKEQFKSAEQIRVAHIVKHISGQTDEAAAYNTMIKVQDELKNDAVFEALVAKYSDCPENGGDLGYITRGQMVEEFEDIAFNLGTNEVSEVFRTRFGYHIVKLYGRRPAVAQSLEEVRDKIVDELKERMQGDAIDEFVDRLKAKADIEQI